jgi:hypothetical protein
MEPVDVALAALFLAILVYILNSDSGGGRRGTQPVT